jgi:hypothetical protein
MLYAGLLGLGDADANGVAVLRKPPPDSVDAADVPCDDVDDVPDMARDLLEAQERTQDVAFGSTFLFNQHGAKVTTKQKYREAGHRGGHWATPIRQGSRNPSSMTACLATVRSETKWHLRRGVESGAFRHIA